MRTFSAMLLLATALTGCGGSGSGSGSSADSDNEGFDIPEQECNDRSGSVVVGDSNVELKSLAEEDKWPQLIGAVNAGVGGDRVKDIIERLDSDVLQHCPERVYVMVGTNDANLVAEDTPWTSKSKFRYQLEYMVTELQSRGISITLTTTIPLVEEQYLERHPVEWFDDIGRPRPWQNSYNDITRDLSEETGASLVDSWQLFVDEAGEATDEALADSGLIDSSGSHMTALGSQVLAEEIQAQ